MVPGSVSGLRNPLDEAAITMHFLAGNQPRQAQFHILAFTPRGALLWPAGSDPLALRIAEGNYRGGHPCASTRSGAETRIRLGRTMARAYQFER